MIQSHGVVLERGMAVGHGWVTGVPCLGEEAEVREPQAAHQARADLPPLEGVALLRLGMGEHGQEQQPLSAQEGQPKIGFPQADLHSSSFRVAAVMS